MCKHLDSVHKKIIAISYFIWYSFLLDLLIGLGVCMSDTDHEVAGSIPSTSINFKCGLDLKRGPPSLVRTIGKFLD